MTKGGITVTPRSAGIAGAFVAFLILVGYTVWVALPLIQGPALTIQQPDGRPVAGAVTIVGQTARVSFLSIDGLPVAVNEDGSFSAKRAYPSGYTEVTIAAKDRFGRERTRTISFITTPVEGIEMSNASTTHGTEKKD